LVLSKLHQYPAGPRGEVGRMSVARSRPAVAADQVTTHSMVETLKSDIKGNGVGAVGWPERMYQIQFRTPGVTATLNLESHHVDFDVN